MPAIADTGFWLALANKADVHHDVSRERMATIDDILVSTWPVLTETCHLLLRRLGIEAQVRFVRSLQRGALHTFPLTGQHAPRIADLMEQYRDLPMDLADASLVVLAEHLGHGRILSTDQRDLGVVRWKHHEPFQNLLLP